MCGLEPDQVAPSLSWGRLLGRVRERGVFAASSNSQQVNYQGASDSSSVSFPERSHEACCRQRRSSRSPAAANWPRLPPNCRWRERWAAVAPWTRAARFQSSGWPASPKPTTTNRAASWSASVALALIEQLQSHCAAVFAYWPPDTITGMDEMRKLATDPKHRRNFEKLLYLAASAVHSDLVAERLSWGIDPNCVFGKGRTPLIANVQSFCTGAATVRALLAGGADPAHMDHAGLTALDYARRKLARLEARPRRRRKSPSLDENNQPATDPEEQAELEKMRRVVDGDPRFLRVWWQERVARRPASVQRPARSREDRRTAACLAIPIVRICVGVEGFVGSPVLRRCLGGNSGESAAGEGELRRPGAKRRTARSPVSAPSGSENRRTARSLSAKTNKSARAFNERVGSARTSFQGVFFLANRPRGQAGHMRKQGIGIALSHGVEVWSTSR